MNTTHSSTAQTAEESVERKLEARATASRERGRDGPSPRGTASSASSRKQTHRVGNQAVRACDTNSFAWRNHAGRASWDGQVDRETERPARRRPSDFLGNGIVAAS